MDHEPLKPEDLRSQFLASHDSIGKNRAESSLQRLQRLNPMVEVTADTTNLVSFRSQRCCFDSSLEFSKLRLR